MKIPPYKGGPAHSEVYEDTPNEQVTHKDYRPPTFWERVSAFIRKHLKL